MSDKVKDDANFRKSMQGAIIGLAKVMAHQGLAHNVTLQGVVKEETNLVSQAIFQAMIQARAHQSFTRNKALQGVAEGSIHPAAKLAAQFLNNQSSVHSKALQGITGGGVHPAAKVAAQFLNNHDSAVNNIMQNVTEGLAQAIAHQDVATSYEKALKDWSQTFKGINECDFSEVLKASQVVALNILDAESLSTNLNGSNLNDEMKDSLPQCAAEGESLQGNGELSLADIEFISAEVLNFSSAIFENGFNWQQKLCALFERMQKKNLVLSFILFYILFDILIPYFAGRGLDAVTVTACSVKDSPTKQAQVIDNVILNTNVIIINSVRYYHEVYVFDEENKLCKQGWVAKKNVQILKREE